MSLPPVVPTVSYDIAVGQHAAWIDFDYQAFNNMATEAGLDCKQIGKLSINFSAEPGAIPVKDALRREADHEYLLGLYTPIIKRARVFVSAIHEMHAVQSLASGVDSGISVLPVEDQLNRAVIHETGHYVDWQVGKRKAELAKYVARLVLFASIRKRAARKPDGNLYKVAAALRTDIDSYMRHDPNSPTERTAYAFEATNTCRYNIVSYQPAGRLEEWELSAV